MERWYIHKDWNSESVKEYTVKKISLSHLLPSSLPWGLPMLIIFYFLSRSISLQAVLLDCLVYDYFPSYIYEKSLRIEKWYFILKFSSGKMEKPGQVLTLIVLWRRFSGFCSKCVKKSSKKQIVDMNQPWVCMCSPSWTPLPPPFPSHPSGASQCTSPEHPVSCIEPGLAICFTYDNIHVSMLFSQIIPPSPSPAESKSLFFTSVSLAVSLYFVLRSPFSIRKWNVSKEKIRHCYLVFHPWEGC